MAFLAVHQPVLVTQGKVCSAVIEAGHPGYNMKRLLIVALPAILSELALVHILVAACAVTEFDPGKLLEFIPVNPLHFVTLQAFHFRMFAL